MNYKTSGVCAKEIYFDVVENKVRNVKFINGCPGNLFGIATLVEDMDIDEAIEKLKGIDCRGKGTSCPDQLSKALEDFKNN
ncbi:MAG: TIGR03905 family TSCPD domain-containing protein [Sarcina sp.]